MRPSFGPKIPSDIFADSSYLKPEHLLPLFKTLIQIGWWTRCSEEETTAETAEAPAPDFAQQCVHLLICFARGGGIKN